MRGIQTVFLVLVFAFVLVAVLTSGLVQALSQLVAFLLLAWLGYLRLNTKTDVAAEVKTEAKKAP